MEREREMCVFKKNVYIYIFLYPCEQKYMSIHTYTYIHVYDYMYVHVCRHRKKGSIYIHIYIYTHITDISINPSIYSIARRSRRVWQPAEDSWTHHMTNTTFNFHPNLLQKQWTIWTANYGTRSHLKHLQKCLGRGVFALSCPLKVQTLIIKKTKNHEASLVL